MIAMNHRLRNDDVCIRFFFGIAGLQQLRGGEERALFVNKAENICHITEWQLFIKTLPLPQITVKRLPLPVQFG